MQIIQKYFHSSSAESFVPELENLFLNLALLKIAQLDCDRESFMMLLDNGFVVVRAK